MSHGTPPARGAILLECLLALAIFVAAGVSVMALVDQATGSLERVRDVQRAADLARSTMSRLEAGIATPETMSGPVRSIAFDSDAEEQETGWELEVETEPSDFQGLSRVTVRAIKRPFEGADRELASFTLTQLMRLQRRAGP